MEHARVVRIRGSIGEVLIALSTLHAALARRESVDGAETLVVRLLSFWPRPCGGGRRWQPAGPAATKKRKAGASGGAGHFAVIGVNIDAVDRSLVLGAPHCEMSVAVHDDSTAEFARSWT